jgi:membrane-bound ClpP family serine protease
LIVYFANILHPNGSINAFDVTPFQDLILDCAQGSDIDLLLQTSGGDIDAAEKLVYMLRERAKSLRVIVTDRAKSAGTLIALAADSILMSPTSELGPIDPQVTITQPDGKQLTRPAQSYLDGLDEIKQDVVRNNGQLNPAYFPLLSQLDLALIDYCKKASERSREFAEKWLCRNMLKNDTAKAKAIAGRLADVKAYRSHAMVIDCQEAIQLGLNIEPQDIEGELWSKLWKLHAASDMNCRTTGVAKMFESNRVSLAFN